MTKVVNIGKVKIGGGNPVAIQTMANRDPHDEMALLSQIRENALLGCDIIRLIMRRPWYLEELRRIFSLRDSIYPWWPTYISITKWHWKP